jgi:hypothetical protein
MSSYAQARLAVAFGKADPSGAAAKRATPAPTVSNNQAALRTSRALGIAAP